MGRTRGIVGLCALGAVVCLGGVAHPRAADGARFALVIQGASGEEQYATLHRKWTNALVSLLRDKFKYDSSHLVVLTEQPAGSEQKATAEVVRSSMAKLAAALTPADQLIVVFIGHGGGDPADAKFNLIGPDLGTADWVSLLKPIKGRVAVVDTTSASFPYLSALAAPGRVVITATSSPAQRYHTMFPEGFVEAFSSDAADADKNGRISLLEAFSYASKSVKQYYEQKGTMATESGLIDDIGDGKGRDGAAPAPVGSLAALTYFEGVPVVTSSDPEMQRLLTRRQSLTEEVDELRRRQSTLPAADYQREFERLMIDLATVSRDIARKSGN